MTDSAFSPAEHAPRCAASRPCAHPSTGRTRSDRTRTGRVPPTGRVPGRIRPAAAQAVAGDGDLHPHQILDLLTLLIDKSLVIAENFGGRTRYRLMETVRQYALEKLGESGEADRVRDRHRDHYTAMVALFESDHRRTPATGRAGRNRDRQSAGRIRMEP